MDRAGVEAEQHRLMRLPQAAKRVIAVGLLATGAGVAIDVLSEEPTDQDNTITVDAYAEALYAAGAGTVFMGVALGGAARISAKLLRSRLAEIQAETHTEQI